MPRRTRSRRVILAALCVAVAGGLAGWAAPARADSVGPLAPLVDAAAQRLQIADPVAGYKWHTRGAIEDPVRVRQELAKLGDDAVAARIDRDYVTRVFGDQIGATEAIEYGRFADWKLNPGDAPADFPDLAASRSTIDGLNQAMLAQISANWDVLHSPACAGQLDAARGAVVASRRLDGLYRRALWSATQSYCQQ
ncbi:chorismate mutase [Mycobacterium timonense]|uniref:Chorismate mutase n=1 Tax=Mycobacterium timonense TaxID=701043 RepID=A0A7I9Z504_9MYCO|nr:chorismate mutase [Mycobacterium timonense]GFG95945.1 secreted chorismate mutase [Mycobacterium timonense]